MNIVKCRGISYSWGDRYVVVSLNVNNECLIVVNLIETALVCFKKFKFVFNVNITICWSITI